MSEKAHMIDLRTVVGSERNNESLGKKNFPEPYINTANANLEISKNGNSASIVSPNNCGTTNCGAEIANADVEYIESEKLKDLEDVDSSLKTLLAGLESKDWVLVCEALNNVRRLAIYHKEAMLDMLGNVIKLVVKSLKNPRSAVCKTAIMTSADIFVAYNDHLIESLDLVLVQLLLKSSQDKRFVCEAADRALYVMTTRFSPALLLPKLEPYLKNRNPRIRAKASTCFCRAVPRLDGEGIRTFGIDKLIQTAASQLSDQLPESREAARILLMELRTMYGKFHNLSPTLSEDPEKDSWEVFCKSKLSPLSAQAVLRVTNVAQEGLVLSS